MLRFCFYRQKQRSIEKNTQLWDEIKKQMKIINCGKPGEYEKEFEIQMHFR